jgi:hypothetical protein
VSSVARRGTAAAAAVVAAAGTGIVTNVATNGSSWSWWAALFVLVAVGAGLGYYLSGPSETEGRSDTSALGAGSVAVGGSARAPITTKASGIPSQVASTVRLEELHGTVAVGPGAVAIGGDATASIRTEVRSES